MALINIDTNPEPRQLRWFAALWLPLFGVVLGAVLYWRLHAPGAAYIAWAAVGVLSLLSLAFRPIARAVFVALSIATYPIGWAVSYLILSVVFYAVITPLALVMRLLGRDPLDRRFNDSAPTYWVSHKSAESKERYFRQY